MQVSWREEAHGLAAIEAAQSRKVFKMDTDRWHVSEHSAKVALGEDVSALEQWLDQMARDGVHDEVDPEDCEAGRDSEPSDVTPMHEFEITDRCEDMGEESQDIEHMPIPQSVEEPSLAPLNPDELNRDQRRAYDIVDRHLQQTLDGLNPDQLLMVIPGEAGVGKSRVIQTITSNFQTRRVPEMLAKGAYTGIAASLIDAMTLHALAGISIRAGKPSARTMKRLVAFWSRVAYFVVDEISMVARTFFARLSFILACAKAGGGEPPTDAPFGGLNVILCGDFHQFPPVATRASEPLYWPCNLAKDTADQIIGREIYEQFTTVVKLTEQVRTSDPVWRDLLQHVRHGNCREHHLSLLRSLIITNQNCPDTNFEEAPWDAAVLVTPRHAVRRQWNAAASKQACAIRGNQLFISPASDTIKGRPLTMEERFLVAAAKSKNGGANRKEKAGLQNLVELAVGMRVMVTTNVRTDLDIANGARGEIVAIVLEDNEDPPQNRPVIRLKRPPLYVLVRMDRTRASKLKGLDEGVIPIVPMARTFTIKDSAGTKKTVTRCQMPITGAYGFTDFRAQGQTLDYAMIDIGKPPSGQLTAFNVYVALSRGRGRENIRLLRDFEDKLFTEHPSEHLRIEDKRLDELNKATADAWYGTHTR
jgi:hypothetical protein